METTTETASASVYPGCAVVLAVALALTACGLGDKAALEDRITAAPGRAEGTVVSGTISVGSRLYEVPDEGVSGFGGFAVQGGEATSLPEEGLERSFASVGFTMDLAADRASLTRPGEEVPYVLFDDLVLYGRRAGVPEDDARPWVRLALDDVAESTAELNPLDENTARAVSALHPTVFTDLVAGTLTGSIETAGSETVAGVETTRYEVNVALDKALGDQRRGRYPEDRREAFESLVEDLGIDGNVHSATVWLDDQDRLRRFRVDLDQKPLAKVRFGLVVTVEIGSYDAVHDLELPTPREVLTVDSVLRFVSTVTRNEPDDEAERVADGLEELVPDRGAGEESVDPPSAATPASGNTAPGDEDR